MPLIIASNYNLDSILRVKEICKNRGNIEYTYGSHRLHTGLCKTGHRYKRADNKIYIIY